MNFDLTAVCLALIKHDASMVVTLGMFVWYLHAQALPKLKTDLIDPLTNKVDPLINKVEAMSQNLGRVADGFENHKEYTGKELLEMKLQVKDLSHKFDLSQHTRQQNNVPY
jgi:hypothetical protein